FNAQPRAPAGPPALREWRRAPPRGCRRRGILTRGIVPGEHRSGPASVKRCPAAPQSRRRGTKPDSRNARPMQELLRSNNLVRLSFLTALLADAGIEAVVFDSHTSVAEGSISAIPRRLMVEDEDYS